MLGRKVRRRFFLSVSLLIFSSIRNDQLCGNSRVGKLTAGQHSVLLLHPSSDTLCDNHLCALPSLLPEQCRQAATALLCRRSLPLVPQSQLRGHQWVLLAHHLVLWDTPSYTYCHLPQRTSAQVEVPSVSLQVELTGSFTKALSMPVENTWEHSTMVKSVWTGTIRMRAKLCAALREAELQFVAQQCTTTTMHPLLSFCPGSLVTVRPSTSR